MPEHHPAQVPTPRPRPATSGVIAPPGTRCGTLPGRAPGADATTPADAPAPVPPPGDDARWDGIPAITVPAMPHVPAPADLLVPYVNVPVHPDVATPDLVVPGGNAAPVAPTDPMGPAPAAETPEASVTGQDDDVQAVTGQDDARRPRHRLDRSPGERIALVVQALRSTPAKGHRRHAPQHRLDGSPLDAPSSSRSAAAGADARDDLDGLADGTALGA